MAERGTQVWPRRGGQGCLSLYLVVVVVVVDVVVAVVVAAGGGVVVVAVVAVVGFGVYTTYMFYRQPNRAGGLSE